MVAIKATLAKAALLSSVRKDTLSSQVLFHDSFQRIGSDLRLNAVNIENSRFYTTNTIVPVFTQYTDETCNTKVGGTFDGGDVGFASTALPTHCYAFKSDPSLELFDVSAIFTCSGKQPGETPSITMFTGSTICTGESTLLNDGDFCFPFAFSNQETSPTCETITSRDLVYSIVLSTREDLCNAESNVIAFSAIVHNFTPNECSFGRSGVQCFNGIGTLADFVVPGACSFDESDQIETEFPTECSSDGGSGLFSNIPCFFGGGLLDPPTPAPTASPTSFPTAPKPTISPTTFTAQAPTSSPNTATTQAPTSSPITPITRVPTSSPTTFTAQAPTSSPTTLTTRVPTSSPTTLTTRVPTSSPTTLTTRVPTSSPTTPTTLVPTASPTNIEPTSPTTDSPKLNNTIPPIQVEQIDNTSSITYDILFKIDTGGVRSCGINQDGRFKCWGLNALGRESRPVGGKPHEMGQELTLLPQTNVTQVVDIACGLLSTCILLDTGLVRCFGGSSFGEVGTTFENSLLLPPFDYPFIDLGTDEQGNALQVQSIAAGDFHYCVVLENQLVKCWGGNRSGQLGLGHIENQGDQPLELGDQLQFVDLGTDELGNPLKVIKLSAGPSSTCAIFANKRVKCWGDYFLGEAGGNVGEMGNNLTFLDLGTDNEGQPLLVKQVECENSFICVLFENGRVKCFGIGSNLGYEEQHVYNKVGNELPFIDLGTDASGRPLKVASIGTGQLSICAIMASNGRLKCWGGNNSGTLGLGDEVSRGGKAGTMGNNLPFVDLGTAPNGKPFRVLQVTGATQHMCAMLANRRMKCWGRNTDSSLGVGDTVTRGTRPGDMGDKLPFVDFASELKVVQVSAGVEHTCVRLANKQAKCFGSKKFLLENLPGAIGDDPLEMGFHLDFLNFGEASHQIRFEVQSIAAGNAYTCVILEQNHRVKCFGGFDLSLQDANIAKSIELNNTFVDLGLDEFGEHLQVKQISGSLTHYCVMFFSSQIKCFGINFLGNLGVPQTSQQIQLLEDIPGSDFIGLGPVEIQSVHALYFATCAILVNGRMKCFGANFSGQLGQGDFTPRGTQEKFGESMPAIDFGTDSSGNPLSVVGMSGGQGKSTGTGFLCALFSTGQVKCLGDNSEAQLGIGSKKSNVGSEPSHLGNNLQFVDLGSDKNGQPLRGIQIVSGAFHTCVLLETGRVKCWGNNVQGQLGIGDSTIHIVGRKPEEMGNNLRFVDFGYYVDKSPRLVKSLSAGMLHTCAITTTDRSICWGFGRDGRLGSGSEDNLGDSPSTSGNLLPYVSLGTPCGPGSVPSTRDVPCTLCPSGTFQNKFALNCKDCDPGSFASIIGQKECSLCQPGSFTQRPRQIQCLACPTGQFNNQSGQRLCTPCEPGTFTADVAQITCTPCGIGLFSGEGQNQCNSCGEGKTTLSAGTVSEAGCVGAPGLFRDVDGSLLPCPSFGNCSEPNTNFANLPLEPGIWRPRLTTTQVSECLDPAECVGGHGIIPESVLDSTVYCRAGHRGPLCQLCLIGFGRFNGLCEVCEDEVARNDFNYWFLKWFSVLLVLIILTCLVAIVVHNPCIRTMCRSRNTGNVSGCWHHFKSRLSGCWHQFKSQLSRCKSESVSVAFSQLRSHIKLNVDFFQVIESYLATFGLESIGRFNVTDLVFFDPNILVYFVGSGNCFSLSFNASLVFFTCGPIVLGGVVVLIFKFANDCAVRSPVEPKRQLQRYTIAFLVLLSTFVAPGVLRRIFSAFPCETIDDVAQTSLLRADLSVRCDERFLGLAIGMLVVYLVFPLFLIVITLYKTAPSQVPQANEVPQDQQANAVRQDQQANAVPQDQQNHEVPQDQQANAVPQDQQANAVPQDQQANAVPQDQQNHEVPSAEQQERANQFDSNSIWSLGGRFLVSGFREEYRSFGIFQFIRKLVQAPMVVFYADGTALQILISIGICVAVIAIYLTLQPFSDWRLLFVAVFTQIQLIIFCLLSLNARDTGTRISVPEVQAVVWASSVLSLLFIFSTLIFPPASTKEVPKEPTSPAPQDSPQHNNDDGVAGEVRFQLDDDDGDEAVAGEVRFQLDDDDEVDPDEVNSNQHYLVSA